MNWSKDKSLMLSRICIWIFTGILAVMCVAAPWVYRWFVDLRGLKAQGMLAFFLATNYSVAIPVAIALYLMNRLLANISREKVFISQNTGCLRGLSWCCAAAAFIFFASGFYYPSFLALCVAALFMALVLRVVKNVFAQAGEIKRGNDYTI